MDADKDDPYPSPAVTETSSESLDSDWQYGEDSEMDELWDDYCEEQGWTWWFEWKEEADKEADAYMEAEREKVRLYWEAKREAERAGIPYVPEEVIEPQRLFYTSESGSKWCSILDPALIDCPAQNHYFCLTNCNVKTPRRKSYPCRRLDFGLARVIFLQGPPGSNCHLYGTHLCYDLDIVYLSENVLLDRLKLKGYEDRIRNETGIGPEDAIRMVHGLKQSDPWGWLPDEVILDVIISEIYMHMERGQYVFLIEGLPKSVRQFEMFRHAFSYDFTLNFQVSEAVGLQRFLEEKDHSEGWSLDYSEGWQLGDDGELFWDGAPWTELDMKQMREERAKDRMRGWRQGTESYWHAIDSLANYPRFADSWITVDSNLDFETLYPEVLDKFIRWAVMGRMKTPHATIDGRVQLEEFNDDSPDSELAPPLAVAETGTIIWPDEDDCIAIGDMNVGRVSYSIPSQASHDPDDDILMEMNGYCGGTRTANTGERAVITFRKERLEECI